MILGIGTDLAEINRFEAMLDKHGDRLSQRILHPSEYKNCAKHIAKRWAAKEACSKALGTGIAPIGWHSMIVSNEESGRPQIELREKALDKLKELTPAGMTPKVHLSLTDDGPLAQAFVVIEAL